MADERKRELYLVDTALECVLKGGRLDDETVYELCSIETPEGVDAFLKAAARITRETCTRRFDACSIINARSGRCPENCKWCAQSAHYKGSCETYELVGHDECMALAHANARAGIRRFSLVASGRRVQGKTLEKICGYLKEISDSGELNVCASLGLLDTEALSSLKAAGVGRYHCNMETAPSFFPTLCSTHTQDDKMRTVRAAQALGMEVCSGGIIGMGETRRQRAELALFLREVAPVSIPINILSPIPGTPLEDVELISEDEILFTVALFRFVHPGVQLRFAGGRARLSHVTQLKALETGINGAIMGDMLTTIGASVERDRRMIEEAGMEY